MILVQKQPQAPLSTSMSSLSHSHRRHPSHPQSSRQHRVAPRAKVTPNAQQSPAQAKDSSTGDNNKSVDAVKLASDVAAVPPAQLKPVAIHTPERNNRGRSHTKPPKDKDARRGASHSTVRISSARRQTHQPSPPAPDVISSQAEVLQPSDSPSFKRGHRSNVNLFDPFLASDDSDTPVAEPANAVARSATPAKSKHAGVIPPIPRLSERPSGRLARRRQPPARSDSPTPSKVKAKAVPVPRARTPKPDRESSTVQLSRSDPTLSKIIDRPVAKRSTTASSLSTSASGLLEWDSFPVCDDTDDTDDTTAPSTPVREGVTWQQSVFAVDGGPRTAPLSSAAGWPFGDQSNMPSTPPKRQRPRHHQRAPSEGVFHMSSDDEASTTPYTYQKAAKSMSALLKRQSLPNGSTGGKRGLRVAEGEEEEKAPYFASSMFQNSPSPEDLPAPTFGARF
ncbi:hypothetical protein NEOLEDRAFT_401511 [Neolentinus lepideus HHB14362 ss-1]|uniref:Uncharacterized protein n=1 Tax=Neolentinus lepideus HHB14362 ss-1 TaxID=1314782 RepID=A0A165SAR4_9AGAM|nr:hypothetical protein NEOLEDRAFT_401511 [Neolentinus lepideus HHB14362 ss-1]